MRTAALLAIACASTFGCDAGDPSAAGELPAQIAVRLVATARATMPAPAPAPARANPPAPAPVTVSRVTSDLPARGRSLLIGCWREPGERSERWLFRAAGDHGLTATHELGPDAYETSYVQRARTPQTVYFDPAIDVYGFLTAGMIHGELIMFQIRGDGLLAWPSISIDGRPYSYTGSTMHLVPC